MLSPDVSLAWRRPDVSIYASSDNTNLVALQNQLFLLGSIASPGYPLIGLRAPDGSPIAVAPLLGPPGPYAIAASNDLLFVGTVLGYVGAIDPASGRAVWWRALGLDHRVGHLHLADGVLFVGVRGPQLLLLDPASGQTLRSDLPIGTVVWSSTTNTAVTSSAETIDLASGSPIWKAQIPQAADTPPVLTDGLLVMRAGPFQGGVFVIQRSTGDILFSSARPAVGNLAQMGTTIFWLSMDGILSAWTPGQTQQTDLASFGDNPIDTECDPDGYYIAVDSSSSTVFVYLGDARELFALSLAP